MFLLRLSEYIEQRLKEDGINERDRAKRLDNLKISVNYVLEYFSNYMDMSPEEELTIEQKHRIEKYKASLPLFSNEIKNWLIQNYAEYGHHMNRLIKNVIDDPYFLIYTEDSEFRHLSYEIYAKLLKKCPFIKEQTEMLFSFLKDYHRLQNEHGEHDYIEDAYINDILIHWIDSTYQKYHVDLREFTYQYAHAFYYSSDSWSSKQKVTTGNKYLPYEYNYKNLNNVFNINQLYRDIPKKKFIRGKKQELEVLIMYYWTHGVYRDEEFWKVYIEKVCG